VGRAQLIDIYGWLVVAAFACVTASIAWVWTFWDWAATPLGRSYMAVKMLLAAALLFPAAQQVFGLQLDSIGYLWAYVVIMGLLGPVVVWRAYVLWEIQRHELSRGRKVVWFRSGEPASFPERDEERPDVVDVQPQDDAAQGVGGDGPPVAEP
jgi:hypothetical protein